MSGFKKLVTFLVDVEVEDHNGVVVFKAKAGDEVDLLVGSANRWIKRGKAIAGKTPKASQVKETAKPNVPPKKKAAPKKQAG